MTDVENLRKGVESAFEDVFIQFHQKLYFFFLKHTKDQYQAEELVQITFLKLWQYRENLSVQLGISEQLFRIAKTSMIDVFRKSVSEKTLFQSILQAQESKQVSENHNDIDRSIDLTNSLRKGIQTMPPVQQKVFRLSRYSGLSNKEIADLLSISQKTVERHITKALHQLRIVLSS